MQLTSKFQRRNKTANFALLELSDLAKDTFLPHMSYDNVDALNNSWGNAMQQAGNVTDYLQDKVDNPRLIPDALGRMRYGLEQPARLAQRIGNAGRDIYDSGFNVGRNIGTGIHNVKEMAGNVSDGLSSVGTRINTEGNPIGDILRKRNEIELDQARGFADTAQHIGTGIQERMNGIASGVKNIQLSPTIPTMGPRVDPTTIGALKDTYMGAPYGPPAPLSSSYNPNALKEIGDTGLQGLKAGAEVGTGVQIGKRVGSKIGQEINRRRSIQQAQ